MPFYGGLVYTGGVLQKYTYTHTAAYTSMQTKTDTCPKLDRKCRKVTSSVPSGLHTHAEHTVYMQGQHAPCPFQRLRRSST